MPSTEYRSDIADLFDAAMSADSSRHIKGWMTEWTYQEKEHARKSTAGREQPFDVYSGASDLLKWFNWSSESVKPDYFDDAQVAPLVDTCVQYDIPLLERHGFDCDVAAHARGVARYNAQDFLLQHAYAAPAGQRINRILDFGAGYGRQACLWTRTVENCVYVGMDAIPRSYCLQHFYYSHLGIPLHDYAVAPNEFHVEDRPGIYHLPTWRADLLPTGFFDMVTCVQVLPELNAPLVRHMISVFARVLRDGGALYIRDHGDAWRPANQLNIDRALERAGFVLEFQPHVRDRIDLHGIPRIWRKKNPEVVASQRRSWRSAVTQVLLDADARLGGALTRFRGKLRRSRKTAAPVSSAHNRD